MGVGSGMLNSALPLGQGLNTELLQMLVICIRQNPQKVLGWVYLHSDVLNHGGGGNDQVHKAIFTLRATQVAK